MCGQIIHEPGEPCKPFLHSESTEVVVHTLTNGPQLERNVLKSTGKVGEATEITLETRSASPGKGVQDKERTSALRNR